MDTQATPGPDTPDLPDPLPPDDPQPLPEPDPAPIPGPTDVPGVDAPVVDLAAVRRMARLRGSRPRRRRRRGAPPTWTPGTDPLPAA
jgi:hypothetical protein